MGGWMVGRMVGDDGNDDDINTLTLGHFPEMFW